MCPMTKLQSEAERSKYLSYLLRHNPGAAKLTLDREGWCGIDALIKNTDFTIDELIEIVEKDEKRRYSFKYWEMADAGIPHVREPTHIRANQGHSTSEVRMSFKTMVPPTVLYHGTTSLNTEVIMREGLKPMSRHHVHLTENLNTAKSVGGRRRGVTTVFTVDTARMLADGFTFFISENDVWLVDMVPAKYLTECKA